MTGNKEKKNDGTTNINNNKITVQLTMKLRQKNNDVKRTNINGWRINRNTLNKYRKTTTEPR